MIEQQIAQQRIKEFTRKYGAQALNLACHAALPVVLNPELLHLLRLNFFLDRNQQESALDCTAEFEFLLSALCHEIGDGLYEIDPAIREELLEGLIEQHQDDGRIREIGELLRRYSERFAPWKGRAVLERAQELTALDALDHQKALQWLEKAEQNARASMQGEKAWFVAMRRELARKERLEQDVRDAAFRQELSFDVVTVDKKGREIERRRDSARQFSEELREGAFLEMVRIPGGSFLMGSPPEEAGRYDDESPQHEVSVSSFYMGKYPVTQKQWETVMGTNPSSFKGDDRPVENVSWTDAQEFCRKLSEQSGRDYRLPGEAEWEYACRAGSATPFHFGPTITPELANYDGSSSYAGGPKGLYREETTPVGSFGHANAFGLYDMHGNLWEWCADPWHDNYTGAPSDGSVWEKGGDLKKRLLRGGSWVNDPRYCRCAYRNGDGPGVRLDVRGFRVLVVLVGRIL